MKKLITAALSAAMLVSAIGIVPAAAEGYEVTTDDITLTYWHYEDVTTINYLAEKFMEIYPNITVETKQISDMSTDLSAAAAAKQFPDVFSGGCLSRQVTRQGLPGYP